MRRVIAAAIRRIVPTYCGRCGWWTENCGHQ